MRGAPLASAAPTGIAAIAVNVALVALAAAGLIPLAVGLAIALGITVAVLRRPQRGVLLLAVLAPFSGLLIIAPLPPVVDYWSEVLVALTAAATLAAPACRGPAGRPLPRWAPAVIALVVLGAASALLIGGVQGLVGMKVTFYYVLVAIAVWRCPLGPRERDRLVTVLMATGAIVAAYGLVQQALGGEWLYGLGYEWNENIRYTGSFLRSISSFNQPFGFGLYLMLVVLVAFPVAVADTSRVRNQLFLLSLPLLALGMFSSFVRAAWLGTAVGLLYLGASKHRALLLLIPVAVVAVALLPPDVAQSALSSSSSEQRVTHWEDHITSVIEHPLGAGIGASGSAAERVAVLTGAEESYQPDNYYFKLLLEMGPLGLWLLVLLLAAAFTSTRATARRATGADGAFARGVSASVLAAAFASLFATYFEIFPLDLLFWLLVAAVAAMPAPEQDVSSDDTDTLTPTDRLISA